MLQIASQYTLPRMKQATNKISEELAVVCLVSFFGLLGIIKTIFI